MTQQPVHLARDGALAVISLNRPERMNAMDDEMMHGLREAAEGAGRDTGIRAVVLRGEGRAFCAGGDVPLFQERLDELPELIVRWGRELHFGIQALRRMDKPVLAVVHGAVAGAGMSLMLAADLAMAADDTKFTLAYARIGASPDGGSTFFLPRLVGYRKAMELALLPDRFDAEAARSLGLVNWVVTPGRLADESMKVALRLAAGPTRAFAETKRLFNASLSTGMESQMEAELQAFARCARTADLAEGVTSFVEKREPSFGGS